MMEGGKCISKSKQRGSRVLGSCNDDQPLPSWSSMIEGAGKNDPDEHLKDKLIGGNDPKPSKC
jgi:hypothetical protein